MDNKYSRYGSYFLANEADDETIIKAKPYNRKRHDFVNDTDPENFADNIDDTVPDEDELAPEGFPMGDISDEPDDPSDNIEPFPDDVSSEDDELDIPEFPDENDSDLNNEIKDFPTDDVSDNGDIPEFPDENNTEENNDDSSTSASDSSSSGIINDGSRLLDDFKNKFGNIPTPDEIIEDLRKKVYGDNPPEATQNNNNNSEIPEFPDNGTQTDIDTGQSNIEPFPGDEVNPMANNMDVTNPVDMNQTPLDQTQNPPPTDNAGTIPEFPGGENQAGGEVITPDMTPMPGGGETDFTNGAEAGMGQIPGTQPQAQPGPGVGYDSMRKYNLYKEYNRLLSAVDNYISKLERLMFDEPHQNLIVKTVIDNLNEVKQLCYDYINMKFEIASYAQSYVFFEELTVSIQVIFSLLMTISSYNITETNDKKKNNKSNNNKK